LNERKNTASTLRFLGHHKRKKEGGNKGSRHKFFSESHHKEKKSNRKKFLVSSNANGLPRSCGVGGKRGKAELEKKIRPKVFERGKDVEGQLAVPGRFQRNTQGPPKGEKSGRQMNLNPHIDSSKAATRKRWSKEPNENKRKDKKRKTKRDSNRLTWRGVSPPEIGGMTIQATSALDNKKRTRLREGGRA